METTKLILATIAGYDRPGVTASLTAVLAQYDAYILDIGQSDIHSNLNLGILFQTTEERSGDILKELLFKSYELGVKIRFSPITEDDYMKWVSQQGRNRYIVTLVARKITAQMIAGVSEASVRQGLNIDDIKRLTGRISLNEEENGPLASVEFSLRGTPVDVAELQRTFVELSAKHAVDISFQRESMYRRTRRLICFDMDSTLIQTEVIDELAERAGVGPQVRAITERAMRGEIDFIESFKQRVALLRGLDTSVMQEIAEQLPMTEGVERLLKVLKLVGFKIAILSGGFSFFGNYLKQKYGIDYVYANELEVDAEGRLTGRYVGDVVDGRRKAELLRLIAQVEGVDLQQTVAVGDGANDLPMLSLAGLGIAFHAKPKVRASAKQNITTVGLDGLLYFLGYKDSLLEIK